jgi:hypothetical protein
MLKLRNENVANEIKYTKYCTTIQIKSSSLLPCVSYVVASLSAEPVLFVLNTAKDSHHVIIDIKISLQFEKILQKGHFYHYLLIPLAPTPPQTCHM